MRHLATYDARDSAPTIITADVILTVDEDAPRAEAMLTAGGRILFVGTVGQVQDETARAGLDPVRADFPGATIVPGFIDAHAHPLMFGQLLTWVDVSPEKAGSIPEIVALMREGAKRLPDG